MAPDPLQPKGRPADLIVLTGFRATGKSVVGRLLADLLGYRFVDTDEEIVRSRGCSIADLVREQGWSRFRELEREVLDASRGLRRTVLATGGGAICHEQQWRRLRDSSLVIWLRADGETIRRRLQGDAGTDGQRPALEGGNAEEEIDRVLARREPLYRAGSDLVIDTALSSPERLAEQIRDFFVSPGSMSSSQDKNR